MVDYTDSVGVGQPPFTFAAAPVSLIVRTLRSRSACRDQTSEFTRLQIAALFVLFAGIAAIPILSHPLPPLSDYVNHLSRMHVIAAIAGDPDLARFYQVDWQVIPNLMMDLVIPSLTRVLSIYAAGQAYTIASFVLILSGTVALNRRLHGSWSPLPLIAFPLIYNYVFLVGTMNYVFGIGLALWALVAWIALREAQPVATAERVDAVRSGLIRLSSVCARNLWAWSAGVRTASLVDVLAGAVQIGGRQGPYRQWSRLGCLISLPVACRSCRCCHC